MTQNYDAIFIGAGVMGANIAFHLVEHGLKTVNNGHNFQIHNTDLL